MTLVNQALRFTLVIMLGTGILFPAFVTFCAKVLFPFQANGSLYSDSAGVVRGSTIVGQSFGSAKYFQPRPSAAGSGYDAANSSGTNLGPTSSKLIEGLLDDPSTPDSDESYPGIHLIAKNYREVNSVPDNISLPSDAATHSASGLDPDISPANAMLQVPRIAGERGLRIEEVRSLVEVHTEGRFLGIIGEPRVNVFLLNLDLDKALRH